MFLNLEQEPLADPSSAFTKLNTNHTHYQETTMADHQAG
jgi:hypothetical protein